MSSQHLNISQAATEPANVTRCIGDEGSSSRMAGAAIEAERQSPAA